MKTIFQMGFGASGAPWLGQEPATAAPQLTKQRRDEIINQIGAALDQAMLVEDFIVSYSDTDPHLVEVLGRDQSRFWTLSSSIAPLYKTAVQPVLERLSEPNPPWLAPSAQEIQDIRTWTVGVSEMYKIYRRYFPVPAEPPAQEPGKTIAGLPAGQAAAGIAVIAVGAALFAIFG